VESSLQTKPWILPFRDNQFSSFGKIWFERYDHNRNDTQMASGPPATPLGIPEAQFIDDIAATAPTLEVAQGLLREKQELLSKYRLLEGSLVEKSQNLKRSRPDLVEDLAAVQKLQNPACQAEPITHFQISDGLYGTAKIKNDGIVALWLGAGVMVEYPLAEAEALLQSRLAGLNEQITEVENNLIFLRNQIITTEVTISRLANQMISLGRQKK
jgi:prefoldin subunit 5